jgi:MoaA/NifB/PqqE/SkfB family radical SAM enzyme
VIGTKYYLNLNYVCNERCVFCASDLTNNFRLDGRTPWLTLAEIRAWVGDTPPGPQDRVMLAGGEPTLHRDLLAIVRFLGVRCPNVTLFSNGLRLADPAFARACVEAGVTRFEIALFGASAAAHEAVTQVRGSFARTLAALEVLTALRREHDFTVEVRLLVSRQSVAENPSIVRLVHARVPGVDAFSLNRLILSQHAAAVDAAISWEMARASINESARLIRAYGYELVFGAIPLCLFEGDNALYVRDALARRVERIARGVEPATWRTRYLDPALPRAPDGEVEVPVARLALPDPCLPCDYLSVCGRVESWYVRRYGTAGLRTVRVADPAAAAPGGNS